MASQALQVYAVPPGLPVSPDYTVRVRSAGGSWREAEAMNVKVDMHDVREAALARFDFAGEVEIEIVCHRDRPATVEVRPAARGIRPHLGEDGVIRFRMVRPAKLSVEIDGDRFHNLHLIAKAIDEDQPDPTDPAVVLIEPGIHRTDELLGRLSGVRKMLYFAPGTHHIEEVLLRLPSGTSAYVAGGAAVAGSFVCDRVTDVSIRGRGMIYLADFGRYSAFRGIRLIAAESISIGGITVVDPPHYSIYLGGCRGVRISDFESFSTRGWSDGIDMMACEDIEIEDIFMRNSDDCIAIYADRWDYRGDTRRITVRDAVLWADVAHPVNIGTHGDHTGEGAVIEQIRFENVDILEHHEPQEDYRGCLAINAGDNNLVRDIVCSDIRIEPFELGRLLDLRVVRNPAYNPVPGRGIRGIRFSGIRCRANGIVPSLIAGYDAERRVEDIEIEDLFVNGVKVTDPATGHIEIGPWTDSIAMK
ncbi:glycosyl hydrolase family 28 protein [Paenibacillus sp. 1P07SE]|uniref:glycosyl hydrolase family 28 protein n=1 Tax=Paenibacillus sp. 1P07SE TaxID=3132209 RepID=UPI0039A47C6B